MAKLEPIAKHMEKHDGFLLDTELCYLDFYLFELLQLINFTSDGLVY